MTDTATRSVNIALTDLSVVLGMPAGRDLHPMVVKSLMATQSVCRDMRVPFSLGMIVGSSVVQWARDEVVDVFLKSSANRLFWVDSDMVWEPGDFMRLLSLSQFHDVVCATYPAKVDQPTFYVNRDPAAPLVANEWGLVETWGVGLGFTVMHRRVVEQLAANAPQVHDDVAGRALAQVFRVDHVRNDGRCSRRGEDMAFFSDIRALGHKVFLDPDTNLGHIGTKTYRGSIRDALQLQ
jgi:hypothetical protein